MELMIPGMLSLYLNKNIKKIITLVSTLFLASLLKAAVGTQNTVPKFSNAAATKIGNSRITDNGTVVGISTSPLTGSTLTVNGRVESLVGGFKFPDATIQTTAASALAVGTAFTGGGANRIIYEDASQNLAASSAMTYDGTTFTVLQSSANTFVAGTDGTAAAASFFWAGDPNTGLFHATDRLSFTTGGTERVRMESNVLELRSTTVMQVAAAGTAITPAYGSTTSGIGLYFPGGVTTLASDGVAAFTVRQASVTAIGVIISSSGLNIGVTAQTIRRHLSNTASLDFGATAAGACDLLTITVTGAVDGDTVALGVPAALAASDNYQSFNSYVSAADTVTVKRCNLLNLTTALSNPAAATVRVDIWQH